MKNMRHVCDIYEPATATDDRGQELGETLAFKGVPCSIEPLNSRELEAARQIYATASHKVELYGDPAKPITHRHYLAVNGRKLYVGEVVDVKQNGEFYRLTCGEELP